MAKLADALDLGSSPKGWGFKSSHPHQFSRILLEFIRILQKSKMVKMHLSSYFDRCFYFFNRFLQFLKNVQKCSKLKFQKFGAFFVSLFHIVFGKEILMNENLQLFKANEVLQYKFITVPKELFVNPKYNHLSSDSKLLYGFILDRFHLSIQNNWKDENDNIYLIFTRKDIQKLFHLSDKTVTKAFKELSDCKGLTDSHYRCV